MPVVQAIPVSIETQSLTSFGERDHQEVPKYLPFIFLLTIIALPAIAQTARAPIAINKHRRAGKAYVYELMEQLNRSSMVQYKPDTGQGLKLRILSVSDEIDERENNMAAALSVVPTIKIGNDPDTCLDIWAVVVSRDRTKTVCATSARARSRSSNI